MECFDPAAVTPEDLLAYASGEADRGATAHIESCAACAAESSAYRALDRRLSLGLFRVDCPDTQMLGELALELLEPQRALEVRAHLTLCPHCREELSALTGTLRGDPLEDLMPAPRGIRRILARLLPPPVPSPEFAMTRGAGAAVPATYEAEDISISLTTRPEEDYSARTWALLGLVIDETGESLPPDTSVQLLRQGNLVSEGRLDEWGHVALHGIEDGRYALELHMPDRIVTIQEIELPEK